MISTMIFDMDGTLIQTERLKATAYARAAVELCPYDLTETEVIEAFKDVVGMSRRAVATALMERFNLEENARARMNEFGVSSPWQAFVQVRLRINEAMLANPQTIIDNQWPHNMALLEAARKNCRNVALATMSYCPQVQRYLGILGLSDAFDFVATRDDVDAPKPDPEIYQLVAAELGVTPYECLAIEDSPSGVRAARAAGMTVIAVATPFTRKGLHALAPSDRVIILDDPSELASVAAELVRGSQ